MKRRIVFSSLLMLVLLLSAFGQEFISGIPPLVGANYVQIYAGDLPQGNTDIYTCPTGKRALLFVTNGYNHATSGRSVFPKIKIGSTAYKISQGIPLGANGAGLPTNQGPYVLNAGESITIEVQEAGTPSVNIVSRVIEFSDANGLKTVRLNTLVAGFNTLYTCPEGKRAILITSGLLNHWDKTGGAVIVCNFSGSTHSVQTYFVPNGSTPLPSNQFSNFAALQNGVVDLIGSAGNLLLPGDSVVIGIDGPIAGELTAYGTVYEF